MFITVWNKESVKEQLASGRLLVCQLLWLFLQRPTCSFSICASSTGFLLNSGQRSPFQWTRQIRYEICICVKTADNLKAAGKSPDSLTSHLPGCLQFLLRMDFWRLMISCHCELFMPESRVRHLLETWCEVNRVYPPGEDTKEPGNLQIVQPVFKFGGNSTWIFSQLTAKIVRRWQAALPKRHN